MSWDGKLKTTISILACVLILFGFQNCGTNFGDPNAEANISFSGFNRKGTTSSNFLLRSVLPQANATVFDAHGCLDKIKLMRNDPRWATPRSNGTFAVDWDAVAANRHSDVFAYIDFQEMRTLYPEGTPLGVKELPTGHFIRVGISFYRFRCGKENNKYHFSVTNDNGTFFNGPEWTDPSKATEFFLNSTDGGFMVEDPNSKMTIHIQKIIDFLDTVDRTYQLSGSIKLPGLVEIE